ncbi:hypothetical protein BLOT_012796 [Blomia tropicalis]|nr:hypothetical protein BLOT_012796 [Blomia tropicalis]
MNEKIELNLVVGENFDVHANGELNGKENSHEWMRNIRVIKTYACMIVKSTNICIELFRFICEITIYLIRASFIVAYYLQVMNS